MANPIGESSGCFWPDVKSFLPRFKGRDVKFKACKSARVGFHVETGFDKLTGGKSMSSIIPPFFSRVYRMEVTMKEWKRSLSLEKSREISAGEWRRRRRRRLISF